MTDKIPDFNPVPEQGADEASRRRGRGDSSRSPEESDEQGISNPAGEEEAGPNDDDGLPETPKRRVPS